MNKKPLFAVASLLAVTVLGIANVSAAAKVNPDLSGWFKGAGGVEKET